MWERRGSHGTGRMRRKGAPFTFSGRIVGRGVGIRLLYCLLCLYVLYMYCSCIYVVCGVHIYLNVVSVVCMCVYMYVI